MLCMYASQERVSGGHSVVPSTFAVLDKNIAINLEAFRCCATDHSRPSINRSVGSHRLHVVATYA
jgi:hypothetical protein